VEDKFKASKSTYSCNTLCCDHWACKVEDKSTSRSSNEKELVKLKAKVSEKERKRHP
jgi:hypothetical protein